MDCLYIEDLEVFANHGMFEAEANLGQKFVVSVKFFYDSSDAGKKDDLDLSDEDEQMQAYRDSRRKTGFKTPAGSSDSPRSRGHGQETMGTYRSSGRVCRNNDKAQVAYGLSFHWIEHGR